MTDLKPPPSDEVRREMQKNHDGQGKSLDQEVRGQAAVFGWVLAAVIFWVVVALVWAAVANAAPPVTPHARVLAAMNQIAGRNMVLDCGYAGVGAEALAFPFGGPDSGKTPEVLSKWMWCKQAEAFVVKPDPSLAKALLILTHESEHILRWDGYADEARVECRALVEVGRFATMLGAPASMLPAINAAALQADIDSPVLSCRDMPQ